MVDMVVTDVDTADLSRQPLSGVVVVSGVVTARRTDGPTTVRVRDRVMG